MITMDDAKRHLRIEELAFEEHEEIRQKLNEALGIVAAYLGKPLAPYPFDTLDYLARFGVVAPYDEVEFAAAQTVEAGNWQERGIDAAVLLILGELWANRESGTADPLSPTVKRLLDLYKPVVFA